MDAVPGRRNGVRSFHQRTWYRTVSDPHQAGEVQLVLLIGGNIWTGERPVGCIYEVPPSGLWLLLFPYYIIYMPKWGLCHPVRAATVLAAKWPGQSLSMNMSWSTHLRRKDLTPRLAEHKGGGRGLDVCGTVRLALDALPLDFFHPREKQTSKLMRSHCWVLLRVGFFWVCFFFSYIQPNLS